MLVKMTFTAQMGFCSQGTLTSNQLLCLWLRHPSVYDVCDIVNRSRYESIKYHSNLYVPTSDYRTRTRRTEQAGKLCCSASYSYRKSWIVERSLINKELCPVNISKLQGESQPPGVSKLPSELISYITELTPEIYAPGKGA